MKDLGYPLSWPTGWPRTKPLDRESAKFQVSFSKARDEMLDELYRLGAFTIIISSNIPLNKNGWPYASYKEPSDPGMAVYFRLGSKPINSLPTVLACDRWISTRDNLRAIGLHLAAIRGIERWGVGSIEQAFMGYQTLPSSSKEEWWEILGVPATAPLPTIKAAYRELAVRFHPDAGGDARRMAAINGAWEEAQRKRARDP